jgi:hypothetical protein
VLFGEDASRVVVSCDPANVARIQQEAGKYGIFADLLGETVPEKIEIKLDGHTLVSTEVSELNDEYEGSLELGLANEPVPLTDSTA